MSEERRSIYVGEGPIPDVLPTTSREQMQQTRDTLGQPPSFSLRQRLGDFAGAFDEEFDRRAEGSILQSKDRHSLRRNT